MVHSIQVANIKHLLTEELFQFQLPAVSSIRDPKVSPSDFPSFVLGRVAIRKSGSWFCEQLSSGVRRSAGIWPWMEDGA
jgi:hypothetical protein